MKPFIMLFICAALLNTEATAQFNFLFQPDIYGKTVDGLGIFQVQNLTGKSITGNVIIDVKESRRKVNVVRITCPHLTVLPGINSFSRISFINASFIFAKADLANIVS